MFWVHTALSNGMESDPLHVEGVNKFYREPIVSMNSHIECSPQFTPSAAKSLYLAALISHSRSQLK